MNRFALLITLLFALSIHAADEKASSGDGWISLFDGKTLSGWKASEHPESFEVRDGMIVAVGKPFSHLFYVGADGKAHFQNFEFQAEVMTKPHSNGGIYFHTKYQPAEWPAAGFEVQVNNTYKDKRKTGSLYRVQDVLEPPAKDNEWFTERIIVQGNRAVVKVNGKTVVDWTQPADWQGIRDGDRLGIDFYPDRRLIGGTFALQAHDPDSVVYYKNIRVKPLP